MTRPSLSTVAYEALVRARRKFSNREEHCIRETWTAEQELVLLRLYNAVPEGAYTMEPRHEGASRARTLIGNAVQEGAEAPHMAPGRQHTGKCRWLPATKDLGYRLSPPGLEEHPHPALGRTRRPHPNRPLRLLQGQQQAERRHRQPGTHHPGRTHAPNSIHRYPPELKSAIRVISKLKRTIQEVEHEKQD